MRRLLWTTSSRHQPRHIAGAVAIGLLAGLLPKFSVMFGVVACVGYLLPIHLPLAILVCLLVSPATPALESTVGQLGLWSLTHPQWKSFWLRLDAQPLLPWLGLHNSVVQGSLLLGGTLMLPVYAVMLPLARRWCGTAIRTATEGSAYDPDFMHEPKPMVREHTAVHPLKPQTRRGGAAGQPTASAAPTAVAIDANRIPNRFERDSLLAAEAPHSLDPSAPTIATEESTIQQLQQLLVECTDQRSEGGEVSSHEVAQRAALMAEYVDQLLAAPTESSPCTRIDAADSPRRISSHPSADYFQPQRLPLVAASGTEEEIDMNSGLALSRGRSETPRNNVAPVDKPPAFVAGAPVAPVTPTTQIAHSASMDEGHHEETLRYLLHHLKAIKDKV